MVLKESYAKKKVGDNLRAISSDKVSKVMHEYKSGTLKSGSGKKVKKRKQALAIALSQARRKK